MYNQLPEVGKFYLLVITNLASVCSEKELHFLR